MGKQIFETQAVGFRPKRNKFDLSHERKLTTRMGDLVPILLQDVLPTDKFVIDSEMLIRFAPMLAPVMHRIDATVHFFFVPNRIIWDEFEDFMTGGVDGQSAPNHPVINTNVVFGLNPNYLLSGSLFDYFGIGPIEDDAQSEAINVLPFRAYAQIFNDWYMDKNLGTEIQFSIGSGAVDDGNEDILKIRKRAWEKDYFTSALTSPQRGDEVLIPIDGSGAVTYFPQSKVYRTDNNAAPVGGDLGVTGAVPNLYADLGGANEEAVRVENIDTVTVSNLSSTINDLRRAEAIQKWLELSARGGSRYVEQLEVVWGQRRQDSRLQRAEYLGGGKIPIQISELLSTFQTDDPAGTLPQGNMAGHGISFGRSNRTSFYVPEHGWIMGILSVMPRTSYFQGVPKKFSRVNRFDYFWPQLARLGEQEILKRELFFDGTNADKQETFGYQSRYCEYKFENDMVHGYFRTSLLYWTLVRNFDATPELNESFVTSDPSTRIFAVTTDSIHNLYVQVLNRITAFRPIPYNSIPSLS